MSEETILEEMQIHTFWFFVIKTPITSIPFTSDAYEKNKAKLEMKKYNLNVDVLYIIGSQKRVIFLCAKASKEF